MLEEGSQKLELGNLEPALVRMEFVFSDLGIVFPKPIEPSSRLGQARVVLTHMDNLEGHCFTSALYLKYVWNRLPRERYNSISY